MLQLLIITLLNTLELEVLLSKNILTIAKRLNHLIVVFVKLSSQFRMVFTIVHKKFLLGNLTQRRQYSFLEENVRFLLLVCKLTILWNRFYKLRQRVLLQEVISCVYYKPLTIQRLIIVPTSHYKVVTIHNLLLFLVRLIISLLNLFIINYCLLDAYCLVQKIFGLLKLVLLQVNATKIIHAAALFLPILELFKNLGHLVIIEQSLIVIAFMQRISCHIYRLG